MFDSFSEEQKDIVFHGLAHMAAFYGNMEKNDPENKEKFARRKSIALLMLKKLLHKES